jgi:glycosidase
VGSPAAGSAAPAAPDGRWARDAIGYEIFVRSFSDSDGDGVGDLPGLTARLDYLNAGDPGSDADLGVDLLWLMPITASPSYHGYDVTDYRAVAADYGTLADFDALVAAADARGIRVITDLVINHTSSAHPWFLDARSGPAAAHRDWYVWRDAFADWQRPWGGGPVWYPAGGAWYYALFWQGMPDLNFQTPAVRAEMAAIAAFWLDRGAAGLRLDAARDLVETGASCAPPPWPRGPTACSSARSGPTPPRSPPILDRPRRPSSTWPSTSTPPRGSSTPSPAATRRPPGSRCAAGSAASARGAWPGRS